METRDSRAAIRLGGFEVLRFLIVVLFCVEAGRGLGIYARLQRRKWHGKREAAASGRRQARMDGLVGNVISAFFHELRLMSWGMGLSATDTGGYLTHLSRIGAVMRWEAVVICLRP